MKYLVFAVGVFVALLLGRSLSVHRTASRPEQVDLIAQLFGESAAVLSVRMVETGDRYFHGGLVREDCTHLHDAARDKEGRDHHDHAHDEHGNCINGEPQEPHEHDHDHGEECPVCATTNNAGDDTAPPYAGARWVRWFRQAVRPSGHVHLESKREVAEVLPWFWVAIKVDPHNVHAYELGAFWLAFQSGEVEKALQLVDEGIRRNPAAFELELVKAEVLFRNHRPREARETLDAAEEKWLTTRQARQSGKLDPRRAPPEDLYMAEILVLKADCYRKLGRIDEAIECFRRAMPYSRTADRIAAQIALLQGNAGQGEGEPHPPDHQR